MTPPVPSPTDPRRRLVERDGYTRDRAVMLVARAIEPNLDYDEEARGRAVRRAECAVDALLDAGFELEELVDE